MKHVYGIKDSHQLIPMNRGEKACPLPLSVFQLVKSLTFFSSDIIYAIPIVKATHIKVIKQTTKTNAKLASRMTSSSIFFCKNSVDSQRTHRNPIMRWTRPSSLSCGLPYFDRMSQWCWWWYATHLPDLKIWLTRQWWRNWWLACEKRQNGLLINNERSSWTFLLVINGYKMNGMIIHARPSTGRPSA